MTPVNEDIERHVLKTKFIGCDNYRNKCFDLINIRLQRLRVPRDGINSALRDISVRNQCRNSNAN